VQEALPADSAPPQIDQTPRGNETILIVEDEDQVRELGAEALEMLGYLVLTASSAEDAIAVSSGHPGPIHLLLSDVVLPQMDGWSLFEVIGSKRHGMKSLFVSGYTENFIVHHGVLDPGVNFLSKPFSVDSLARKVREILDR
jgi:DNA-binding NtrC family response regulator